MEHGQEIIKTSKAGSVGYCMCSARNTNTNTNKKAWVSACVLGVLLYAMLFAWEVCHHCMEWVGPALGESKEGVIIECCPGHVPSLLKDQTAEPLLMEWPLVLQKGKVKLKVASLLHVPASHPFTAFSFFCIYQMRRTRVKGVLVLLCLILSCGAQKWKPESSRRDIKGQGHLWFFHNL